MSMRDDTALRWFALYDQIFSCSEIVEYYSTEVADKDYPEPLNSTVTMREH